MGQNSSPDPFPARVEKSHRASVRRGKKKRNAVGGKNGQGLAWLIGQKAVDAGVFFWLGKPRDDCHPAAVDLLGRGGRHGDVTTPEEMRQRPRSTGIAFAPARREESGGQVCWKKAPLFSEPVCTPRMAIMISSGLEEASSAVSSEISFRAIRSTSA